MSNYPETISLSVYIIERLKQLDCKQIFGVPGKILDRFQALDLTRSQPQLSGDFNLEFLDYIEDDDTLQWVGNANELNAVGNCH